MASFKENIREILYNDVRMAGHGVALFDQFLEFDAVVGAFIHDSMTQPIVPSQVGAGQSIASAGPSSPPPLPEFAPQSISQQAIDLPPLPSPVSPQSQPVADAQPLPSPHIQPLPSPPEASVPRIELPPLQLPQSTPQSIVPDSTELPVSVRRPESLPPLPAAPAIAGDAASQLPPFPSPPTPVSPVETPELQRAQQTATDLPSSPEPQRQSSPLPLPEFSSLPRQATSEADFLPESPSRAVENPIDLSPSPPSAAVPVATAQAPPLPAFPTPPVAAEPPRMERQESEAEMDEADVAEIVRQHRSAELPPLQKASPNKRRQYGGSSAADLSGHKEYVEQKQNQESSTQSVIDAVIAAQADIANRRHRQDDATLEIMERTAYRQSDHERRLREINSASQRSVSTLTDQYVI